VSEAFSKLSVSTATSHEVKGLECGELPTCRLRHTVAAFNILQSAAERSRVGRVTRDA
jgi:hypothetical protein